MYSASFTYLAMRMWSCDNIACMLYWLSLILGEAIRQYFVHPSIFFLTKTIKIPFKKQHYQAIGVSWTQITSLFTSVGNSITYLSPSTQ